MKFSVVSSNDPAWAEAFDSLLDAHKDVFYKPNLAVVYAETVYRNTGEVLAAIGWQHNGTPLIYVFVKRQISSVNPSLATCPFYDTTSLYGRGGIVGVPENKSSLQRFSLHFAAYCEAEKVICSFDRLHPVIANHQATFEDAQTICVGDFVTVSLQKPWCDVVAHFKPAVRKDIRKAARNNISIFYENNLDHLEEFLTIYRATMDRRGAASFYYFETAFFHAIERHMPDNFLFFYALDGERTVSAELVFYFGDYAHSMLGGTMRDALPTGANSLLKVEIISALHQRGCKFFLLGGGNSPDDGIFKYKRAFAPDGVSSSFVGASTWNADALANIKGNLTNINAAIAERRFQFYDIE